MSCYYLSRRIAIVLLPVAAQSDGQSSAIAGHHGSQLGGSAAGTGLSLSTRQATTQFGLSSSTTHCCCCSPFDKSTQLVVKLHQSSTMLSCSPLPRLPAYCAPAHASGRMVQLCAGSDASDQLADGHRKHVQLLLT